MNAIFVSKETSATRSSGNVNFGFEKPAQKLSPEVQNMQLKAWKEMRETIISKNDLFREKSKCEHVECGLKKPAENVFPKADTFCSKFWKSFKKHHHCSKKSFFKQKKSSEHVDCSSNNHANNLYRNVWNSSAQTLKNFMKSFFSKKFPKRFTCSFCLNALWKFLQKIPVKVRKYFFLPEKVSLDTQIAATRYEFSAKKCWECCWEFTKSSKKNSCSKKNFLRKNLLSTSIAVLTKLTNLFRKSALIVGQIPRKLWTLDFFSRKTVSLQKFYHLDT